MNLKYSDFDEQFNAFVFELDDVLFPVKDYDLQVYYLFANFLEYLKPQFNAAEIIEFIKHRYDTSGNTHMFEALQQAFNIDESYLENLNLLFNNAQLPLKLLLYKESLSLLQEIIINRKQVFILASDNVKKELNKIKQTEWHGMDTFLKVYFDEEIGIFPIEVMFRYFKNTHKLKNNEIVMVGKTSKNIFLAKLLGIKFINVMQ